MDNKKDWPIETHDILISLGFKKVDRFAASDYFYQKKIANNILSIYLHSGDLFNYDAHMTLAKDCYINETDTDIKNLIIKAINKQKKFKHVELLKFKAQLDNITEFENLVKP